MSESLPDWDFVLGLAGSHGIFVGREVGDWSCAWGRLIRFLCDNPNGRQEVATCGEHFESQQQVN